MTDREAKWIAVDWGTTHLRAWVFDGNDKEIAALTSAKGMGRLNPVAFEYALLDLVAPYLRRNETVPVICCGMVGARQGWIEAKYRQVPCSPLGTPLTKPKTSDPRIDVLIVPGLCQKTPPDVMRGEETQLAGLLNEQPEYEGVVCLPGTHSKWCRISKGAVTEFRTFLSGELFSLLSRQSVLRHSVDKDGWFDAGFVEGVNDVVENPAAFASELFSVRARHLLTDTSGPACRARLSGLVIGLEIAGARPFWENTDVTIIGADRVSWAYAAALSCQNVTIKVLDPEKTTLSGLRSAYKLVAGATP